MLRKQTFWGGVHPAGRKELSSGAPLEDCPPPREVVIPLLQHIGKPCTPLVKAGDHVDMGQKIGDGEGLCVPVHASVSGTVKAVEPRSHPSGQPHLAVVIENDFQNTYHSAVPPCADTDALDADALIRRIREAGLVGMGGATFPTDIKANIGKVETLIANACECEPYITADDALLCTDADRAIRGLRLLRQLLKPRRTVIAIEDNKERAVSILTDKLKQQDEVELVVLPTRYPQGAEKQLIQAVTGRQVPSGGFPKDVGCAVFNIATCASVCRAVADGEPILRRIVTITGHGIKEPKNLIVPIGTPFAHAIEAAVQYVDMLQIGARNMQNFELLKEVGKMSKPILLKRGLSNTYEEWIMSAEYIMSAGNENVILCERGVRTFETYTRNTLDVSAIPAIKQMSHLPVIVDPSHAAGMYWMVEPLALAAVAAGADGLIIEVHNDPAHAKCDGQQSLTPEKFQRLMDKARPLVELMGKHLV